MSAVAERAQPILRIRDLVVTFDNAKGPRLAAVDGVGLSVYPGQVVALVGESGCGKSVTAMSVLRLNPSPPARYDSGRIEYARDGRTTDLLSIGPDELREIRGGDVAMIFQEPMTCLNPVYTIGAQIVEAVELHQGVRGKAARRIAVEAMRDVGIPSPEQRLGSYPHEFSGGMRQRVMIAMALACRPRLLLADEPTTALDVTIQAQILELLHDLRRRHGMGILLITHDLGVVAQHADVVCVMYAGRVVEYARASALFSAPTHPYTRGLLASIPRLGARRERLRTIAEVTREPGAFEVRGGRAWWPWNDAPEDVERAPGAAGDTLLAEVAPSHWVRLWRTEASRSLSHGEACIEAEVVP